MIPFDLPRSCAYFERGIDKQQNEVIHNYYQVPEFAMRQFVLPGVFDFELPALNQTQYIGYVIYKNELLKYNKKWKFATFLFYPGYHNTAWQIIMLTPFPFKYDVLNDIMRSLGKVEPFRKL